MRLILKLAFRYLFAPRRSLARVTAVISVAAIATGVAAMIVSDALTRGFADELRERLTANTAHVRILAVEGGQIADADQILTDVRSLPNVRDATTESSTHAAVSTERATSYAIIKAVDDAPTKIGKILAESLSIKPGGKIEVITANSGKPVRITIEEILETGVFEIDSTLVTVPKAKFAALNGETAFVPKSIEVRTRDIFAAPATSAAIRSKLGPEFRVIDWEESNRPLFSALSLERRFAFLIIMLIVIVAALNITTSLTLLVNERRFDVGVLRACGMRPRAVAAIFLAEALLIGAGGTLIGIIVGLTICAAGNRFRLVDLPADIYLIDTIPFHPAVISILMIGAGALVLAVAAAALPALGASRLTPSENLRVR